MKTAIYIVKLIPKRRGGTLQATVYRHKKNAMTAYESYSKLLFCGQTEIHDIEFLKYTFVGTPQTVVAKALEVGSVLSRGNNISSDPFCDGDWDSELLHRTAKTASRRQKEGTRK